MRERNWKLAKRFLALLLASVILFSGIPETGITLTARAGEASGSETLTVSLQAAEAVYTGDNLLPAVTVLNGTEDVTQQAVITWTVKGEQQKQTELINAGTYICSASYQEESSGTTVTHSGSSDFVIRPKSVSDSMVGDISEQIYDGTEKRPVVVTDIERNKLLTENTDYTVSYTANINAVEQVTAVVSGKGNYSGEVTKTFKINPKAITGSDVSLSKASGVYTGIAQDITVKAAFSNYKITYYKGSVADANKVDEIVDTGSYKVRVEAGDSNYTGFLDLDYCVTAKPISSSDIAITFDKDTPITYNGQIQKPSVKMVKDGTRTLAEGEDKDYVVDYGSGDYTARGSYTVTISGRGNYQGQTEKVFVIQTGAASVQEADFIIEGEGYQKGYYRSVVTVKVDGYKLSETETDDMGYQEALSYSETLSADKKIYLKDVNTGEILGPVTLSKSAFTIIKTAPSASAAVTPSAEAEEWTSEKTINISAPQHGVSYYYSETSHALTKVNAESDLADLTAMKDGTFTVDTAIGERAITYYVYAVDQAGNVAASSVDVKKVDNGNPEIQINKSNSHYDAENDVFWKNAEDVTVLLTVTDESSGVAAVEITPSEGAEISTDKSSVTFKTAGTYTLIAEDQAGNRGSVSVTVRQDTGIPEIAVSNPETNSAGKELKVYDDGETCWINQDSMRLPFVITDNPDGNSQQSGIKVEFSTDAGVNWTQLTSAEAQNLYKVFDGLDAEPRTYLFRVSDIAGNVSAVDSASAGIKIASDMVEPVVTSVDFTQADDGGWINKESIGTDAKAEVTVTAAEPGDSSGVAAVSYVFSQDANKTSDDYADSDFKEVQKMVEDAALNTFTFYTEEAFGTEEYPDGTYYWIFRVTDHVGNYTEYTAISKIDTTLPEETAYARFVSDTEGVNSGETVQTGDSWLGKIYSFASDKWNQICGRKKVQFELYLKDCTSGIADAVLTLDADGTEKVLSVAGGELSVANGLKAFVEGAFETSDVTENEEGYTVINGNITVNEKEDMAVSDFVLTSVTDMAGNVRENYILNEGQDIIYLDTVMPKLTAVTVDGVSVAADGPFYYAESKNIRLEINERFFAEALENGAAPVFTVFSRSVHSAEFAVDKELTDAANAQSWTVTEDVTKADSGEYLNSVEIALPVVAEQDTEYQFTVSFRDSSGNLLTNGDSVSGVVDGVYTSQIFALSSKSPSFGGYSVTGVTDRSIDGTDVYHMGTDGAADVTLAFTIEDNDEYWAAENVTLDIYNLSSGSEAPVQTLDGSQITWMVNGNAHSASYDFSGGTEPAKYRVVISYINKFGNEMRYSGDISEEQGSYTSSAFILDHEAPVYTVGYNEAYRLVKDGDGNTGEENDKRNAVPETSYTAYYNDDIEVNFAVEDDFAIASASGELNSDFELKIIKDGEEMETIPRVTWRKNGNLYEGNFSLREEGTYEIRMGYRDAAGNRMEAGTEVTGSKTNTFVSADGVYTSTALVLDRTAPQITTAYVDRNGNALEPSAIVGERNYFREDVYLQVSVSDKNIRYSEFKDALLNTEGNLRVYDILGNAITDDSVTAFFNRDDFMADTVSHDGVLWRIPLFLADNEAYGANYEITLNYEDLSGNGAEGTSTDNKVTVSPTFDGSMPQQDAYIYFTSDVLGSNSQSAELMDDSDSGWMSRMLDFLSDKWLKIFGKEKIAFKMYLRDQISGIDSVKMEYTRDKSEVVSFGTDDTGSSEVTLKISEAELERKDKNPLAGYMVLDGEITVPEGQDVAIEQFRLTQIKDVAGNIRSADDDGENFILHNVDDETDLIYLDRIAPKLDIDYTKDGVFDEENGKKRIFYRDTATLSYRLTERFFAVNTDNGKNSGNVVEPTVNITGTNKSAVEVSRWSAVKNQNYHASATIRFPAIANGETEYNYTVAYEDAAGNLLTAGESCKGEAVEGVYKDYTIVLDKQAPRLTSFEIQGDTDHQVDGVSVYHNDGDSAKNDVTIAFTVDDNDSYWNSEALTFEIYNASKESEEPCVCLAGSDLRWETSGRLHSATYGFDGEDETPASYYVKIRYADRAGNDLVSGSTSINASQFSEGVYTSTRFALDHVAPVFNISYNEAYRVVDNNTEVIKDSAVKTPQTGYTSYYNDRIDVEFTITEHYLASENGQITNQADNDVNLSVTKDGRPLVDNEMPEITWTLAETAEGTVYKARFTLSADGRYQISVSGRDAAMNRMTAGNRVQGSESLAAITQNGSYGMYKSTLLVLDTHAPTVSLTYVDTTFKKEVKPQDVFESTKRNYFAQPVYLRIAVKDTPEGTAGTGNVRYQELKNALVLVAKDAGGKVLKKTKTQAAIEGIDGTLTAKDLFVVELPVTDEANYDFLLEGFEDMAGNKVNTLRTKACVDMTQPEASLSYELSRKSGFVEALKYGKKDIWFADSTLLVTASVKDATAGVREIAFTIKDTDSDGKTQYRTETFNPPDTIKWKNNQTFTVPIPLNTADFDGTITATVTDWANQTYHVGNASVIESKKTHNRTKGAEIITNTKPSRVVGGVDYYNTDINFTFSMKDEYSGIREYSITPGKDSDVNQDFSKGKTTGIRYNYKKKVTLSSKNNNRNGVNVAAKYTDNTNHTVSVEQQYNIDITAPIIEVAYNLNEPSSERYYKETRVATVTIIERNFDEKDVEFNITNSEGTQPTISGWSQSGSGDATRNTCTVTYSADGDYTFSVAYQDKAGNRAFYNRVDEFTIDQTSPVYTVTYDNNEFENEYYYKEGRTATIDITEHNFDPDSITVEVTRDGAAVDAQLSGWSTNGDHNTATVPFKEDGEYTFTISGMDSAQNELEPYTGDHFVIDTTVPRLEIQNIENMSANSGVVAPRIVYNDTNYDASRTSIIYEGYQNGEVDYSENGTTTTSAQGAVIAMNDVERVQENDDIYTMKVVVYDKAGNLSEAEKIFSVNRFGSVYTFEDAKTKALLGGGLSYTNTAQNIVVKETNVDTLEFKEITCNHDGTLLTMNEGKQYEVKVSGSDVTWKQYVYTMYKDNFEKDGRYTIKILSEDRAANVSDNDTKGKKMEFVMDTVAPSALVSGVTDNGIYRTNSQNVAVDVEDNVLLGRVRMYVNDQMVADYDDVKELSDLNGMINYSITEQNYAQSFRVIATDAAGNDCEVEIANITVNTSWWRLFLANKPLLYCSIAALILLAAFVWFMILVKKKKRDEEAA